MANSRINVRQIYNENSEVTVGKSATNIRSTSFKKTAFGDLKNIIHNQQSTPRTFGKNIEQPFKANTLKFQTPKSISKPKEKVKIVQKDFDEDLISNYGCRNNCFKKEQKLWSEMYKIDDNLLNKVLNGGDNDAEPIDSPPLLDMDDDLDDLKYLMNVPVADADTTYGNDDFFSDLKMPTIEDFDSDFVF